MAKPILQVYKRCFQSGLGQASLAGGFEVTSLVQALGGLFS